VERWCGLRWVQSLLSAEAVSSSLIARLTQRCVGSSYAHERPITDYIRAGTTPKRGSRNSSNGSSRADSRLPKINRLLS